MTEFRGRATIHCAVIAATLVMNVVAPARIATPSTDSPLTTLTADDGRIAQRAVKVFSQRHLVHPVVDDALSEKMMDRFIRSWDPQKLYFLKADVAEFETQKTLLDDQLLAGNVEFANAVVQRFQQRLTERLKRIGEWIDADHDFTVNESLTTDATQLKWAATSEELDERWRKQVKYELLLLKLKGYDAADSRLRLQRHYERTQALSNQVERHELLERYLTALTNSVDPRALFLSEETMAQYNIRGIRIGGIGIRLVEQDGYLVVQEVIPGGTADADGEIEAGDRLIGVADDSVKEFLDIWNMKLDAVYDAIRGPLTTMVKLQILKPGGHIEVYKLKRADNSNNVAVGHKTKSVIIDSADWIAGANSRIGVLSIPVFTRDFWAASTGREFNSTAREVRTVLERWEAENVDAIMLDLRGNSSGPFAEALDLFQLFAGKGPVVQFSVTDEPLTSEQSEDPGDTEICWKQPLVIICDRITSGSAEVFCAAIQDYQRGIMIGDARTHGKGTVQNVVQVKEGTSLFSPTFGSVKCTIAALFRVTGNSIQYTGVTSDIVLPSLSEVLTPGAEVLENAMKFEPISTAKHTPFTTYVSDSIIADLSKSSRARVLNSRDFRIIEDQIQRHIKRRNEKSVSLNQSDAESRMKDLKAEEDLAKQFESRQNGGEVFPKNYYNTEVVHIATDYIQLLKAM